MRAQRRISARAGAAAGALLLAAGAGACSPDSERADTETADPATSATDLDTALERSVAWSSARLDAADPYTLVVFDFVHRRYAIAEFADARALARSGVADADPAAEPELRLVRPDVRVNAAQLVEPDAHAPSVLVRGALACDEPGTPAGFEARLDAAIAAGGYDLTHAAVAIGIEVDLGCAPTGGDELRARIVDALATQASADTRVDDVAIERLAMLEYLGARERIPAERVTALIAAQRADGSFPADDTAAALHATVLATWVIAGQVEAGPDPQGADAQGSSVPGGGDPAAPLALLG